MTFDTSIFDRVGIKNYGIIKTEQIPFQPELREFCEANRCRQYSVTWACPPAIGTLQECMDSCTQYSVAAVFSFSYKLEDCFDYEGMMDGCQAFKDLCDRVRDGFSPEFNDYLFLTNEGCTRCEKCTYPDEQCRFPDKLMHSLEGYAVPVNKLASQAGISYTGVSDYVTYYAMVLYNRKV